MVLQIEFLPYQIYRLRFDTDRLIYLNLPISFDAGSIPTQSNEVGQKQPNYNSNIAIWTHRKRLQWTAAYFSSERRASSRRWDPRAKNREHA